VREIMNVHELPLRIHVVVDGEQAINFIVRAENDPDAPAPDLVLLDLNLPRRDGFEVLMRLRESAKYSAVPVIVITSSDAPSDRARAAALGATYFRKPPAYDEFLKLGDELKRLMAHNGMTEN